MHLNPPRREAAGRSREGRGGDPAPPANRSARRPPRPLPLHAPKFQTGPGAAPPRCPSARVPRAGIAAGSERRRPPCARAARTPRAVPARSPPRRRGLPGPGSAAFEERGGGGRAGRRRDPGRARGGRPARSLWRQNSERGSRSGRRPELASSPSALSGAPRPRGRPLRRSRKMVVLRSSLELHGHSAASATDSLDLSNEFVNLEQLGRRRLRSARAEAKSAVPAAGADVSTGGTPGGHGARGPAPGLRGCPGPGDGWWGEGSCGGGLARGRR